MLWELPGGAWFPKLTRPQSPMSKSMQRTLAFLGRLGSPLLPAVQGEVNGGSLSLSLAQVIHPWLGMVILQVPPTSPLFLSLFKGDFPRGAPALHSKEHPIPPSPLSLFTSPFSFPALFHSDVLGRCISSICSTGHTLPRCNISAIRTCLTIKSMS